MTVDYGYETDGAEIYRRSFAIIRAEADLAGLPADVARVVVRMIHSCGLVDLVADLAFHPDVVAAARRALDAGAPVLCDTAMVASGITRSRLPAGNEVICTLGDPAVPALAHQLGTTRTAAALDLWGNRLSGAVVAVGNAPTALFRLLELLDVGAPRPAAILGLPVGFVGAAESKDALAAHPAGVPHLAVRGRRGGSAMAVAAVNAIASEAGVSTLYGIGVGPGDPELLTVKAVRLITAAPVVAFYSARHGNSIARSIAAPYLRADQTLEPLVYPVTTEETDHPGGYEAAITEFYDECAERLAAHLAAGRDVVVLCAGDPMFYGSYMYLHERLAHRFPAEVVPGITSVSAASAVIGRPLVERDEILTVLPGTLPSHELARRLAETDAAAVLKLGRTFETVRGALADAGRLDEAWYVERATSDRQRHLPLADVDPDTVPYFSIAIVPSTTGEPGTTTDRPVRTRGEVVVVGLGPAGPPWLTPEATRVLREAEHIVGYGPYVDRVPHRPGQHRHASGNQVETRRAAHALELAKAGAKVAVVSSGDPGVFGMAAAVLEVATTDDRFADVAVRVVPGVSAAHAAASRVGAPLGHDYAVLSLSDRLKPWPVIEARLDAAAAADLVIALYNPASTTRRWQVDAARGVLLRHRKPATPVVVARDVGGRSESIVVTDLGGLDPDTVDMRCLLIVGSSQSRADLRGDGTTVVWTPRTYPA